jgi:hypothetical protein
VTPLLRISNITARVVAADEKELRRASLRLHTHAGVLFIGILVITFFLTSDMGEMAIFIASWSLSGFQELADYLGQL